MSSVNSVDYSGKDTVHTGDIRWGVGEQDRKLDERTAGLLVPYMLYTLLPSTVDAESAKDLDVVFGIESPGNGAVNSAPRSRMANLKPNRQGISTNARLSSATTHPILC